MKIGNSIGNIEPDKLGSINYFDIVDELCKRNFDLMGHNYLHNLTEFQYIKDKAPGFQRLMITRIFIRSLLMVNSFTELPHLDKILVEIDVSSNNMVWLDKLQTIIIPYCNEYQVFTKLREYFI